uniref:Slit homolog 2 protein-like n=1 Tax=Crassostrea virginica TaxID=6565 RepID=A0A8B8BDA7_CRAVI|nr:slit homolog 2 protein-like [Crassostrea virginica]
MNSQQAANLPNNCTYSNYRVDCSNRTIMSVPDEFPPFTKHIYLNGNNITVVHRGSFQGLGQLLSVNLYQNKITSLESKAFFNISTLEEIILNDNKIHEIFPWTFLMLDSLYDIYLDNNKISVIHPRAFEKLPKLQAIHLRGNNIQCTCAIEWFDGNPILHEKSTVKCSSPSALNGDNVADLRANNHSCGNRSKSGLRSDRRTRHHFVFISGGVGLGVIGSVMIGYFRLKKRRCMGSGKCNICAVRPSEEEELSPVIYTVQCPAEPASSDSYIDNMTYTGQDCSSLYTNVSCEAMNGYETRFRDSTFVSGPDCKQAYNDDYDSLHILSQETKSTQTGFNRRPTV